jgi:ATP-binding cassette subfamily B protein RaxB
MLNLDIFPRRRIKLVNQSEMAECGLACLFMVGMYYGYQGTMGDMRRRFGQSSRGMAMRSLLEIAEHFGLAPRAVKLPLEMISGLHLPAILHWDMKHFVVIEKIHKTKVLIHDPAGRSAWMSLSEISDHFTGVAVELRPSETFSAEEKFNVLSLPRIFKNTSGSTISIIQVVMLSLILQAFVIALPYYMQISIDKIIPSMEIDYLTVIASGFVIFSIINAVASMMRSFVLLSSGTLLGLGLSTDIGRHLLKLPIDWFERRHIGDIISRFQSVGPIQTMLTQGSVAITIDGFMAISTLIFMIYYSYAASLIAVSAIIVYLSIRSFSFYYEKKAKQTAIIHRASEQTTLMENIRGIRTLRIFSREGARHSFWHNRLVDALNAEFGASRIGILQATANGLIISIQAIVTTWLLVRTVIYGSDFTVGMIFAYMAYQAQFIQRSVSFIDQIVLWRMLGLHLERISDIVEEEQDKRFIVAASGQYELAGQIELKEVCYRYAYGSPLVLSGVNLMVSSGEHIAITGVSGGGKTTLVKVLLGLVSPTSGEVFIDELPMERFGYQAYLTQAAAVMQDDNLFSGTIADNISLNDDAPIETVISAAKLAHIHDDIIEMPMQYRTLVGDMGSFLSGGQKQRILLARALYKKPKLLIMDEGSAHLDTEHERKINAEIKKLGITRIIVAHRRETIACAERVLEMREGRLIEISSLDKILI